jgi:hypothetical protein
MRFVFESKRELRASVSRAGGQIRPFDDIKEVNHEGSRRISEARHGSARETIAKAIRD